MTSDIAVTTPLHGKRSDNGRLRSGGLRTPGFLIRWPMIGLLMVLLGGIAFGVIALSLQTNAPLMQVDVPVANDIHAVALQSSPFIRDVMIFGFYLGEHGILLIGIVLLLYFVYKRFWPELSMVVVAWAGEGSIWLVVSGYFNRHRPVFDVSVWRQMTAPGFPSGHSISAVMCFGLLAYLLVPMMPARFWKVGVIMAAVLVILYIGFSRIFVGDHYLTDVLAGYALGVAWSGLAYTFIELIFKKRIIGYVQEK
jgi:membrane-associated phospholipid phosphatase